MTNTHARKRQSKGALPEYLEQREVEALINAAPDPRAVLFMLCQWRAGLRVSETVALEGRDLTLDAERPTLRVRRGKGDKDRVVPVHPELNDALKLWIILGMVEDGPIIDVARQSAWRWVKAALKQVPELEGRKVGTHTLRHSCARHWLMHGVPINRVSRWLGHASIQTTLVYLELAPDPAGILDDVP